MSPDSPLTDDHRRQINEALRAIVNDVRPLIGKCEACKLNVADAKQFADYLEERLTSFKREFFPREV